MRGNSGHQPLRAACSVLDHILNPVEAELLSIAVDAHGSLQDAIRYSCAVLVVAIAVVWLHVRAFRVVVRFDHEVVATSVDNFPHSFLVSILAVSAHARLPLSTPGVLSFTCFVNS